MLGASSPVRVLFVCRGNLCRSPMAMALFNYLVAQRPGAAAIADSAGYYDWAPFPREAHPFARRAVAELTGIDLIADHRAKPWTFELVNQATPVVVAEEWMEGDFPQGKAKTLKSLAGETGDVPDPYGRDLGTYLECGAEILRLLQGGLDAVLGSPPADGSEVETGG